MNPNGLSDSYVDYGAVAVNHTRINYNYAIENPLGYRDYGPDAGDLPQAIPEMMTGVLATALTVRRMVLGVISPTAAIGSIPYTPEVSLRAMQTFYRLKDRLLGPAGFYDAYSPQENYWVAEA